MFQKILHRPALAIVISLILLFLGGLAVFTMPVSQFPSVAPPQVQVFIAYPGASAKVLEESVLIPLERSINGVQDMRYMTSDATSAGEATIQIVFRPGTDPAQATINVITRIDRVKSQLPELVQREGIIVSRVQPQMLMYINLYSTDKDADMKYLFNYANANILPEIKRIKGVGGASILGSRQYAMRVWLKPDRMRAYGIATEEVMEALSEQSVIGSPGRLGLATGQISQSLEYVLTYQGRYNTPSQYGDIIIRSTEEGESLYLKDIAEVELGSEFYDIYSNLNEFPSAAIVLKQSYGSNAQEVIDLVKAKFTEIEADSFPPGMSYEISYDVSSFLDASIEKVLHTLVEAFVLVALVVFVFLGDWRSTLIPILVVPVSLIGTFFFMLLLGVNINLITLFALILAIGIVVDNAIVVVEAVHAKMHNTNLGPYRATREVLHEIAGAIIAITLVMSAVFIPVTFMSGPIGVFYRQFSITMAVSIILSGILALTLTPVLCAILLKRPEMDSHNMTILTVPLEKFNAWFERLTGRYADFLKLLVPRRLLTFAILVACTVGIYGLNTTLPSGFIPNEDQGILYAVVQTPPGTTLERTYAKIRELQDIALEIEGVQSVSSLAGYEVLTEGRGSNAGTALINLKPWNEREHTVTEIVEEFEVAVQKMSGVTIEFFGPPAIPGFGAAGGFSLRLLDKTNTGDYEELGRVNESFMAALRERPELRGLFTFFTDDYPQYELEIDNQAAMQKGVSIKKALDNLSILIGSTYEQGFIRFGQFYKVYVQSAPEYRRLPSDLDDLFVDNEEGEQVPYSAFMSLQKKQGLNEITRFNAYPASSIQGSPAAGYSSGEAIKAVQEVAAEILPRGYDIDWAGLALDEANRGNEALYIFLIVVVFIYLVLVAQYESFLLPLAVITSLPVGILGSFVLLQLMGLENNVFAQIGLIMLVGLLGKNAILIVEFAVQKRQQGMSLFESAVEGGRIRLRPILMTSFAFIAGLIPLVLASGAGAIGNKTIGASSAGGMLLGTILGVILVPGLYYAFAKWSDGKQLIRDTHETPLSETYEFGDN